jgi:hypothetical protein
MTADQINGAQTSVNLDSGNYSNPLTVTSTGSVSNAYGSGIHGSSDWTIVNRGQVSGYSGISLGATGSVDNSGTINGANGYGVYFANGGTVTNETGGVITGAIAGIGIYNASGTVANAGTIEGRVVLEEGGTIANEVGGTITGAAALAVNGGLVDNAGVIGGIVDLGRGGTLTNESGGIVEGGVTAIRFATVENSGTIENSAMGGIGVSFTIDGGAISGSAFGVSLNGYNVTVENSGTISGGKDAVFLYGTGYDNRLIIDPGATFDGNVVFEQNLYFGGGAYAYTATLQLNSGVSAGTLSGLGTKYSGFENVQIEKGAAWDITGTEDGFFRQTIDGFNSSDQIDVTDLAFDAGDKVTVNSKNQLVVTDPNGNVTIQLDSSVKGDSFTIVSDGNGGTLIEEGTGGTSGSSSGLTGTIPGIYLNSGSYPDPLTIAQSGTVTGEIYGNTPWTIVNQGTVNTPDGVYAIYLNDHRIEVRREGDWSLLRGRCVTL